MLVRDTVPKYWLFTLLSPPQDRQPPKGDPGLAHLSPFLIPGLGMQQARALFSLLTRGREPARLTLGVPALLGPEVPRVPRIRLVGSRKMLEAQLFSTAVGGRGPPAAAAQIGSFLTTRQL